MGKRVGPEEVEADAPLFDPANGGRTVYGRKMLDPSMAIFGQIPPHNHTPTSIAAAESKRDSAATERLRVLEYIKARPNGATREEIEDGLDMPGNTVRPRVWELLGNQGHTKRIREGIETRQTRSGRKAAVLWAVTWGEASAQSAERGESGRAS